MVRQVPTLALSHGQVLSALSRGKEPTARIKAEVRYLRLMGIPFSEQEVGRGRGNRIRYDFDQLIELAIAFFYLDNGLRPKDLKDYLPRERKKLLKYARDIYAGLSDEQLKADWLKSGDEPILANAQYLPFHDRYSGEPGRLEFSPKKEMPEPLVNRKQISDYLTPHTRLPNGEVGKAMPITRIIIEALAYALAAPETKPGLGAKKAI